MLLFFGFPKPKRAEFSELLLEYFGFFDKTPADTTCLLDFLAKGTPRGGPSPELRNELCRRYQVFYEANHRGRDNSGERLLVGNSGRHCGWRGARSEGRFL
jgi:hypothetical protein